ncbi:hypothetical protein KUL152_00330 [Tenacibaculum sp. KUL152]|nr:hypothetical protein KUL152_00330 [Tenacibaculum sp. KUL152]
MQYRYVNEGKRNLKMACLVLASNAKAKQNKKLPNNSSIGDIIMPTDAQLLIGKVLQIKDKLSAKRHCIPRDLQGEWKQLDKQTACFESTALYNSAVKGQQMNKHIEYSGSVKELSQLVSKLKTLNNKVSVSQAHH